MTARDREPTAQDQLDALTPEVVHAYARGELAWGQIRRHYDVVDFGLLIRRVGGEGLRLPRAAPDRPTLARAWLREALQAQAAATDAA